MKLGNNKKKKNDNVAKLTKAPKSPDVTPSFPADDNPAWKVVPLVAIRLRPGTEDWSWECEFLSPGGGVKRGVLSIHQIFIGPHIRRRVVPKASYPL
jgi:hypothetical protein